MFPLNLMSRLASRPQLLASLTRNVSTSGKLFEGCGCRSSREDCPPKKCSSRQSKAKKKCKPMPKDDCIGDKVPLPDFCAKTALAEFSWKMQELQKNWESIAAQMEKDCEERGARSIKEKPEKPKSCDVKPPTKPHEKHHSNAAFFVVLGALAIAAAIAYYLYLEHQKKEGDAGDEKKEEEKKEEKKE